MTIPIPRIGYEWHGVGCWRNVELLPYIFERDNWHCLLCWRKDISCHEGIVTRANVQGIRPKERQILCYHPANSFSLCHVHHNTELEPSKQQCLEWVIEFYGEDFVYGWLRQISKEFKVIPPFVRSVLYER